MSRTVASIVAGIINTVTLPLSVRQKKKTIARIINSLEMSETTEVLTAHGKISFHSLKSAFTASATERFHTDEPETLVWIDGFKEGEVFWDIGANIGVYSLYAGLLQNILVYAFEPSGFNFGLLTEHIRINNMGDRVKPLCIALGKHTAISDLRMCYIEVGHGSNSLGVAQNQIKEYIPKFTQAVPAFSIDDFVKIFLLKPPDHLKIDVDGIEPDILAGARETLTKVTDVLIEVEGRNLENVAELIEMPICAAGLHEDMSVRNKGSKRNRLYTRKRI